MGVGEIKLTIINMEKFFHLTLEVPLRAFNVNRNIAHSAANVCSSVNLGFMLLILIINYVNIFDVVTIMHVLDTSPIG